MLEPIFSDVLVCSKKDKRPLIEIFVQPPENINQQNLGTLAGVFEITDESEDSSYIVNYLISVIKKEYFANVKRGTIESFEAALHKANLALSKLAEHDNVNWIGNLHAICLVCEKNNIHLAQTGRAQAYLIRSKNLSAICENQEESLSYNPLKTFEDVISGRLQESDKIIVTTETIMKIFSTEEIKRSAIKFSPEDFIRFLKTALINELEKAAALVIDINQKQEKEMEKSLKKPLKINAFSQEAYKKPSGMKEKERMEPAEIQDRREIAEEIKKDLLKSKEGFIDKKTGHIYIIDDGQSSTLSLKQKLSDFVDIKRNDFKEIIAQKITKGFSRLQSYKSKSSVDNLPDEIISTNPIKTGQTNDAESPESDKAVLPEPDETARINKKQKESLKSKFSRIKEKVDFSHKIDKIESIGNLSIFYTRAFLLNRVYRPLKEIFLNSTSQPLNLKQKLNSLKNTPFCNSVIEKTQKFLGKTQNNTDDSSLKEPKEKDPPLSGPYDDDNDYAADPESHSATREEKREWLRDLSALKEKMRPPQKNAKRAKNFNEEPSVPGSAFSRYLPNLKRIKNIVNSLNFKGKAYAIATVMLIFVIPYFIVKFQNSKNEENEPKILGESSVPIIPLEEDKNVIRITDLKEVYTGNNLQQIIGINDNAFLTDGKQIISLEDKSTYDIPEEFQHSELASGMDDLNLLFLIKEGKILSWSVTAKKFQTNVISFPDNSAISSARSYLTYLYLMDNKNNRIYRYPRAEGGFGSPINWLKEDLDLSKMNSMSISEDMFLSSEREIVKFSKGKKQYFSLENSATPISIDKIFIKPEFDNLYILDTANARIIETSKEGSIIRQYYHTDLSNAVDLIINEKNKRATILFKDKIKIFSLSF